MNESDPNHPFVPPLAGLTVGVLAASTASILIRYAQQDASSLVIAAYRLTLATVILLPVLLIRYRSELFAMTRRQWELSALAGVFLAAHFATWISSLAYTTVASSAVLVSSSPLFVALLAPLVLNERLTKALLIGLGLALCGTVIVGIGDACSTASGFACPDWNEFVGGKALLGDLLALAGAAAGGAYMLIGRGVRRRLSLIPYIGLVYGVAALCLLGLVAMLRLPALGYAPKTYLWFLLLALFPQLTAHSSINWALRFLPAATVSIALLGEPVASSVLALILLGETPPLISLFGGMLILIGIAIAIQKPATRDTPVSGETPPS